MKKLTRKIAGILTAAAVAFSAAALPDMGFLPGLTAPVSAETPPATAYTITLNNPYGDISAKVGGETVTSAEEGATVTLTVTCTDQAYSLNAVSYNDGEEHIINPVNGVYSFTMPAANVTVNVSALPNEIPVYRECALTFDANGGSGEMVTITAYSDSVIALPECTFTPPAGKKFKCWEIDGSYYDAGGSFVMKKRIAYAIWEFASDPVASGNFADLRSLINDTENSGTLVLDRDYMALSTESGLVIGANKTITIDLGGHKIDRALTASKSEGYVIGVAGEGASLTVTDSTGGGTITGGANSGYGGGVYVENNAVFILNGGTISGNKAPRGGGVYVATGGSFTLPKGGSVSDNEAENFGGGVYVSGGSFTLSGGTVSGNKVTTDKGGGVYVQSGTFTMESGTISSNTAKYYGGGVYVQSGTVTISGGTISSNEATNCYGGGVHVEGGTVTMSGGTISSNTAKYYGGGVYVGEGSFTLSSEGEIALNTASQNGGGVYVSENGTFDMSGGTISKNTAGSGYDGGGVYACEKSTFTLSGGANITGNVKGGTISEGELSEGTANNVYLQSGTENIIKVKAALTGSVGVTLYNNKDTVAVGVGGYTLKKTDLSGFTGDESGSVPVLNTADGRLYLPDWSAFSKILNLSEDKSVPVKLVLGGDLIAGANNSSLDVSNNKYAELDLNGHTIDRRLEKKGSSGFVLYVSGSLTVTDSSAGDPGKITGGNSTRGGGGVYVNKNGIFTLSRGEISGNYGDYGGGVFVYENGSFDMSGGTISGNTAKYGGGVYVEDGTFTMSGGTISGNTAQYGGGVETKGIFTMSGGSVSDNTASYDGGGVYVYDDYATFTMKDGEISNNEAKDCGGGVSAFSGSFTMEGGKISKNTAKTGGGVVNYITFVMSGGEISENTASLSGGGVEATSYGTFTLSGGAKITKNVTGGTITDGKLSGGTANNVCLRSGTVMKVSAALTGTVGVTPKNVDQDIAEGTTGEDGYTLTAADVSCLISEISGKFVCLDSSGKAKLCAVGNFAHLQQLIDGTAAEGTVKLDTDFTALSGEKALNIASGKIITIDLNGHTIDRGLSDKDGAENGYVIGVAGELTVTDSSEGDLGKITGGNNINGSTQTYGGGVYVDDNGTFYLKNGVTVYGDVDGQGTIKHFGTVTITETTGGTVTASEGTLTVLDGKFYIEGATVTLTAAPASFSPVVKDSAGKTVSVTNAGNGTFTFTMPDKDVTVEPEKFTVAVTPVDTSGNAVAVQGSWLDSYVSGTSVTLTAPAKEGYNFVGWYAKSAKSPFYKGDALSTNNVYTFTITADTSLAAVYQALGKVSLTIDGGSSFTINGDAKSTSITADYTLGTTITVATDTAKFAYWKNSYGMILSRSASYTFTVTGADTITAVFDTVVENKATLVFESAYGQVMAREQLATGGSMEIPSLPYRNGYTAKGWDMNGDGVYSADDTVAAAITRGLAATNNMVVISPVYELKTATYTITVTGGTGGGTYNQNDKVTVTANEPGENQKFSHWTDGTSIMSYNASYQFFADRNLELTAVFVADTEVVDAKGTTEIISTSKDATAKTMTFVSLSSVPNAWTISMAGIIATNDATIANSGDGFNDKTATFVRGHSASANYCRYTWTKSKVDTGDVWYVRAYLVCVDAAGNTHTIYGDMVSQTM